MPEWATVSIRGELIEEVRKILKSGRYRSISEFIAEAIRLRLEELSQSRVEAPHEVFPGVSPITAMTAVMPGRPEVTGTRMYINTMLERSEQIWWVLVKLFGDMLQKDVKVDPEYARELRNCRSLINFVRSHVSPECDVELANERLPDLQNSLEKAKRDLIAMALCVRDDYARDWMNKIDKAERGELAETSPGKLNFVPGLPKDVDKGWTRIMLTKPLAREKIQEILRTLGVTIKFEDNQRIVIKGDEKQVRKAVQMISELQSGRRI